MPQQKSSASSQKFPHSAPYRNLGQEIDTRVISLPPIPMINNTNSMFSFHHRIALIFIISVHLGPDLLFEKNMVHLIQILMSSLALCDLPLSTHPLILSKLRELLINSSCTRKRKCTCLCNSESLCHLVGSLGLELRLHFLLFIPTTSLFPWATMPNLLFSLPQKTQRGKTQDF